MNRRWHWGCCGWRHWSYCWRWNGAGVGFDDSKAVGLCDATKVGAIVGGLVGFKVGAAVGGLFGLGVVGGCVARAGSLMQ